MDVPAQTWRSAPQGQANFSNTEQRRIGQNGPMSQVNYIPDGFHTVTPYFIVADGPAFLAFLKSGLGAEEIAVYKDGGGRIMHAQLRLGDSMLEFGEATEQYPSMKLSLHVYVSDTDALYQRAVAAGAKIVRTPRVEPYGERSAGVEDPAGNAWWIATRVAQPGNEGIDGRTEKHGA
jgi:uncharacterized glyoxalase superfamily protein PhnB